MRSLTLPIFLLLASFAGGALALDPAVHNPVVTDPTPDTQNPTANKQLLVPSGGVGMNAVMLMASGAHAKPTLVLLHGLPGNERNLDLAQAVRRAGWNVLTFAYRGNWGSPGKFSIAHSVADAGAAVAYLHRPDVAKTYRVDPARIVIAGHSMGGFAAAQYAAGHDDVIALLLIDAWNVGATAEPFRGNVAKHAELIAEFDDLGNALAGADAESLANEVEHAPAGWDLRTLAPKLVSRPVFTIWADRALAEQNQALADAIKHAGGKKLTTAHMPTDHAFSDHRIDLARHVVAWLDSLPKRAD
ncbi:MAG: alpha/beta fold hydrolase [Arenimonas sp.]